MEGTDEIRDAVRAAGMRVTAQRVAVLATLREIRGHLPVEAVTAEVERRIGSVSQQAVYNALHALAVAGLARRIEPAGSPALYEARAGDNHHHVVCRSCGAVTDVPCVHGEAPCLAADTAGYDVDEAEIVFWGRCPTCRPTPIPTT